MTVCRYLQLLLLIAGANAATTASYAQVIDPNTLAAKVASYNTAHPNDMLYIVTDKTLYAPLETIWFAGYLIETNRKSDSLNADILSVALVKDDESVVEIRKNYLLSNNFSAGSLTLPDTLPNGNYLLIAHTNIVDKNKKPIHVFRTPITVTRGTPLDIGMNLEPLNTSNNDTIFLEAKVFFPQRISSRDRHNAELSYNVSGGLPRQTRINVLGEAWLSIPMSEVRPSDHVLHTTVTTGRQTKQFKATLPDSPPETTTIDFYPEGGRLINELPNRVAWKVRVPWNQDTPIEALLLENGHIIDTLQTNGDGLGQFSILPKSDSNYALKVLGEGNPKDTGIHWLPRPEASGVALQLVNAVANDTLTMDIATTEAKSISFAITNLHSRLSDMTLPVSIANKRRIHLPLHNVYKGLNVLTLLDENGHPIAQRNFFAHADKRNMVSILTSAEAYRTRDSVSVAVSLENSEGQPLGGVFTISCVQLARLDTATRQDMASHYYSAPLQPHTDANSDNSYDSRQQLETRLLIDDTHEYLWQQIIQYNDGDKTKALDKLKPDGAVKWVDGRDVKRPLSLLIRQGNYMYALETDSVGSFSPNPEQFTIPEDERLFTMVMDREKTRNQLYAVMKDPLENIVRPFSEKPLKTLTFKPKEQNKTTLRWPHISLDMPQVIETVEVHAKGRHHAYNYGANKCGDWVCIYEILNCPNHPPNASGSKQPIKGNWYKNAFTGASTVYSGCLAEEEHDEIVPIYTTREFFGMYTDEQTSAEEAQYMSAIFWEPFATATQQELAVFSFYTSDLKGVYQIRIEGFAENGDFLYAEKNILVGDQ